MEVGIGYQAGSPPSPARRARWPWFLAAGLGAIVIAAAAVVIVVATEIGTPAGRFRTAPDACALLSEETVRALVGEPRSPDAGAASGRRHALRRDPDRRSCHLSSRETDYRTHATLRVEVFRFPGTQLKLGPGAAERAEDYLQLRREMSAATQEDGCKPVPVEASGEACGAASDPTSSGLNGRFQLHLRRDNVVVVVHWSPVQVDPADDQPGELMPVVATEILAALDILQALDRR